MFLLLVDRVDSTGPTVEEFLKEEKRIVNGNAHQYIKKFDLRSVKSIMEVLGSIYPGKKIEIIKSSVGVTDVKIVKVDGIKKHILKRVALPNRCFKGDEEWSTIKGVLESTGKETLREQANILFLALPDRILRILNQSYPHINYAQREKLAYIFGKDLGVPYTGVFKVKEGVFSFHHYVEHLGSALRLDIKNEKNQPFVNLQDLQNIGILDILLENQDRNPRNILVVKKAISPSWICCFPSNNSNTYQLRLVPIDHALCYQQEDFLSKIESLDVKKPCWTNWKRANEELTKKTKNIIKNLKASALIKRVEKRGLVVDDKVKNSIR